MDYVQGYGRHADYVITIKWSDKTHARPPVELCCDHANEYKRQRRATPVEWQHACSMRLIGCTWKALGKQEMVGNWSLSVITNKHNHPSTRRLTKEDKVLVSKIIAVGALEGAN